jgi:hypothetical protein
MSTAEELEHAVEKLEVWDQLRLIQELPPRLNISLEDIGWLQVASRAFDFWNNPDDACYDEL